MSCEDTSQGTLYNYKEKNMLRNILFSIPFFVALVATGCGGSSGSSDVPPKNQSNNSSSSSNSNNSNNSSSSSNSSQSSDSASDDGNVPNEGEDRIPAELELFLTTDARAVRVSWSGESDKYRQFNLCFSASELNLGFQNCTSHDGAQYFTGISSPHLIDNLSYGATYWAQIEAEQPDGARVLSDVRNITVNEDTSLQKILAMGPFAGLGPLSAGSELHFYELDEITGLRLDETPAAVVAVTNKGGYTFPELEARWIEVAVEQGKSLNLYHGEYINVAQPFLTAIFDQHSNNPARNVNILTTWQASRARKLLQSEDAVSLEAVYAQASAELYEDFQLSYPPEELNFFYDLSLPRERLNDFDKLLSLSGYLSQFTAQAQLVQDAYAADRMESIFYPFATLKVRLGSYSATYTGQALATLLDVFSDSDADLRDRKLMMRTIAGCESARVWSDSAILCLGEGTGSLDVDIPSGSGTQDVELVFYPETSGMWSLELKMNDNCTGGWSSHNPVAVEAGTLSHTFEDTQVAHSLVSVQRTFPGPNYLSLEFDGDRCSATTAQLNFHQVTTGVGSNESSGYYYLTVNDSHLGVVSGYVNVEDPENSPNRAYYFLENLADKTQTVDIVVDYRDTSSSQMDIVLAAMTPDGFSPKSELEVTAMTGELRKRYELPAQSMLRLQVSQEAPTTTSVNSELSHERFTYSLTVGPVL